MQTNHQLNVPVVRGRPRAWPGPHGNPRGRPASRRATDLQKALGLGLHFNRYVQDISITPRQDAWKWGRPPERCTPVHAYAMWSTYLRAYLLTHMKGNSKRKDHIFQFFQIILKLKLNKQKAKILCISVYSISDARVHMNLLALNLIFMVAEFILWVSI